jgi:hypothetical protein
MDESCGDLVVEVLALLRQDDPGASIADAVRLVDALTG